MSLTPGQYFAVGFQEGVQAGDVTVREDVGDAFAYCFGMIELHLQTWKQNLLDVSKFRNYGNYWGMYCALLERFPSLILSHSDASRFNRFVRQHRFPYAKSYVQKSVDRVVKQYLAHRTSLSGDYDTADRLPEQAYGLLLELKHILMSK